LHVPVAGEILSDPGREQQAFILVGEGAVPIDGAAGSRQIAPRAGANAPKTSDPGLCGGGDFFPIGKRGSIALRDLLFQQRVSDIDPEGSWPGRKIDFVAPRSEIIPRQTEAIGEIEYVPGRNVNTSHIVGKIFLQTAALVKGVVFFDAGALADHALGAAAAGAKKAKAQAVIDARAALYPVEPGEAVVAEQFGIVEF